MTLLVSDRALPAAALAQRTRPPRRRELLRHGAAGLVLGYAVLSPFAMVFFHLSHRGLDPKMVLGMHHSVSAMVVDAFSAEIPLWWLSFAGLGALLGVAVGVVVSALRARGQKIEEDARELARANAQLEQTNRKLDESYRQLLQADKMASLGLMSGTVIHDLRNHLQALITVAECELEDRNGSEQAWALVLKQARAMRELADSVRRFAAKSAGRRVACDLHAVVEDALLILHKAIKSSGVTLRRELAARSAIVEGDPNELLQLAINLLQNALDAMPAGGEFRVATRDAPDSGVELVVADTGAGIPRELRERVFEAFFTTKPEDKGTGLGLAICKRIVESHRGSLTLESEEGVGASFRVLLPLATPPIKIT